jgi:hypothetical protein
MDEIMSKPSSFRPFRAVTALVVIFQLLVLQGMAASCDLHHTLHPHSDDSDHQCVVTQMQCGGYDISVPDVVPVEFIPVPPQVAVLGPIERDASPSHLAEGLIAHAPPRGP